jgi:N-acetylglutamate synthase-like GNAT family acetyltransferase
MIEKIKIEDLDVVLEILKQDVLRYCDGRYPEKNWIGHFITDNNCFAFGLYENNVLISVLLSEKLSYSGCMLWYMATDVNKQYCGYGGKLLNHFEIYAKRIGIEWIFLNATDNSLLFYSKHNFTTSKFSKVYEHVKEL